MVFCLNGIVQWDCEKSDEAPEVVAVAELALTQGLACSADNVTL
ncbi:MULTISPECIES: hypothetical protein [unclassified Moorena]|nr:MULTISPECIES: hypothetical protein [unclassified Moorena]